LPPYNLIDFHPSVAFTFTDRLTMSADIDFFWRYSTDDGLYGAGGQLLRSGAGSNARYIATQFEWIVDYELTENLALNASYSVMPAGPFIRETGRSDTIHLVGLEVFGFLNRTRVCKCFACLCLERFFAIFPGIPETG
jgi:hypothetical protein